MSDEPKGDGHRKYRLRGGPHDGITIRVYPTRGKWNPKHKTFDPPTWDDIDYNGELYEHPHQQHPTKPYLLHRPANAKAG